MEDKILDQFCIFAFKEDASVLEETNILNITMAQLRNMVIDERYLNENIDEIIYLGGALCYYKYMLGAGLHNLADISVASVSVKKNTKEILENAQKLLLDATICSKRYIKDDYFLFLGVQ